MFIQNNIGNNRLTLGQSQSRQPAVPALILKPMNRTVMRPMPLAIPQPNKKGCNSCGT
jgi:hypothetical protein